MNPLMVAQARSARLVREAHTPAYSTSTPKRQHFMAVEVENDYGYRMWHKVREDEVDAFVRAIREGDGLSDIDHHAQCWCQSR